MKNYNVKRIIFHELKTKIISNKPKYTAVQMSITIDGVHLWAIVDQYNNTMYQTFSKDKPILN